MVGTDSFTSRLDRHHQRYFGLRRHLWNHARDSQVDEHEYVYGRVNNIYTGLGWCQVNYSLYIILSAIDLAIIQAPTKGPRVTQ